MKRGVKIDFEIAPYLKIWCGHASQIESIEDMKNWITCYIKTIDQMPKIITECENMRNQAKAISANICYEYEDIAPKCEKEEHLKAVINFLSQLKSSI